MSKAGFVERLDAEKLKILTIDDDDDFLELNVGDIVKVGFAAVSVRAVDNIGSQNGKFNYELDNPRKISKILKKEKPTAIIMDYHMENFNAPALIEAIRATPEFENIAIMIRSAPHKGKTVEQSLQDEGIDPKSVSYSDKNLKLADVRKSIQDLVARALGAGAPPLP